MPTERLSMRDVREILRQKWQLGRSHRQVAGSVGASAGAVGETMRRAKAAGVTNWAEIESLSPSALEARLYPSTAAAAKPTPDCAWIHRERRRVGVTLQLLHDEYAEQQPDGYGTRSFASTTVSGCGVAGRRCARSTAPARRPSSITRARSHASATRRRASGSEVELFVAVLGASNLTYAEATRSQRGPDWIGSHTRAFAYFGGVTAATVCDQLKPGVTVSCRYEPGIQRTYEEMAEHYGTTVLPARPTHPRDKPKVEVRRADRAALDTRAAAQRDAFLAGFAQRAHRGAPRGPERPADARVPGQPARALREARAVDAQATARRALRVRRVVAREGEPRLPRRGRRSLLLGPAHASARRTSTCACRRAPSRSCSMGGASPRTHAASSAGGTRRRRSTCRPRTARTWSGRPSRIINWAGTIGPQTRALAQAILTERTHPEQGYRSCLGILRLGKRYGDARLEAACARALAAGGALVSPRRLDPAARPGSRAAAHVGRRTGARADQRAPRKRPRTEPLQLRRNASCSTNRPSRNSRPCASTRSARRGPNNRRCPRSAAVLRRAAWPARRRRAPRPREQAARAAAQGGEAPPRPGVRRGHRLLGRGVSSTRPSSVSSPRAGGCTSTRTSSSPA